MGVDENLIPIFSLQEQINSDIKAKFNHALETAIRKYADTYNINIVMEPKRIELHSMENGMVYFCSHDKLCDYRLVFRVTKLDLEENKMIFNYETI